MIQTRVSDGSSTKTFGARLTKNQQTIIKQNQLSHVKIKTQSKNKDKNVEPSALTVASCNENL